MRWWSLEGVVVWQVSEGLGSTFKRISCTTRSQQSSEKPGDGSLKEGTGLQTTFLSLAFLAATTVLLMGNSQPNPHNY